MPAGVSAYTALANVTLGSSAASVTFSSFTSGFRDLVLVSNLKSTSNNIALLRFNSDTGANYTYVYMEGSESGVLSETSTLSYIELGKASRSSTETLIITNIMDFNVTNKHKTVLQRENRVESGSSTATARTARWANTAAITSITISTFSSNLAAGSTFALYGIAA